MYWVIFHVKKKLTKILTILSNLIVIICICIVHIYIVCEKYFEKTDINGKVYYVTSIYIVESI